MGEEGKAEIEGESFDPKTPERVHEGKEKSFAFRKSPFFGTEEELKKFRDLVRGEKDESRRTIGEIVLRLHHVIDALPLKKLEEELARVYRIASKGGLSDEDEVYLLLVANLSTEILNRGEREKEVGRASRETERRIPSVLEELTELNRKLLIAESDQLDLQKQQIELLRRSDFSAFVSAMEARAGINVQQFDIEPPLWYSECSSEWKRVIKTILSVLHGAYLKFKSSGEGAESIISSEDIRIEKEALASMWEKMLGFRVAIATMICDLFEEKNGKIIVSQVGKKSLENTDSYLDSLVKRMHDYFFRFPKSSYFGSGGPKDIDRDTAARFVVSAAFNLFYLSGVFESGDLGNGLKDSPKSFNSSVRAFFLPRDQARSKYVLGEEDDVGTNEAWGGPLGEWFAERIRHDLKFKDAFLKNEGPTKIMPERLMYSMFDLTYFEDGKSLSQALLSVLSKDGKETIGESGLVDYKDPESVNWRDVKYSDLWGGYSALMGSAWKIYQAIIGRADPEFNQQALCDALSKLRKDKTLKDIYAGESGEWIVKATLISLLGGPNMYSTKILLKLDELVYDYRVWKWLEDDRILACLPPGARGRIFKFLNARDPDRVTLGPSLVRIKLRKDIHRESQKWR